MVNKNNHHNIRHYISDKNLLIKRRDEIINTSSKVFMKKGFDRTGLDEISEALGMTKGGLYRYIGSKDDILHLILEYTQEITDSFIIESQSINQSNPKEKVKAAVTTYLQHIDRYQAIYKFNNHVIVILPPELRRKQMALEASIVSLFERYISEGVQAGIFKVDSPKYIAHTIVVNCGTWSYRSWVLRNQFSLDAYIDHTLGLVFRALQCQP